METAKQAVAEQMQGRFQTFADNFLRGMRPARRAWRSTGTCCRRPPTLSDQELMAGIDSNVMPAAYLGSGRR